MDLRFDHFISFYIFRRIRKNTEKQFSMKDEFVALRNVATTFCCRIQSSNTIYCSFYSLCDSP